MKKTVKTIVFPVGGLGTRFLPATKATPKEMLPHHYGHDKNGVALVEKFARRLKIPN